MNHWDKFKKWLFGSETDARKRAERHLPNVSIGLATSEAGDRQDDVDGMELGGVIWPVEQGTHGARSFVSSQCFYAEYDKKAKKVWLLDNDKGTRHPGALPLIVGDSVFPVPDTGGRGVVIRTALFGDDGLKKNIFVPQSSALKAHHEQPDPPINSTLVYDEDGRAGGLHYLTRVRRIVTKFCLGATDKAKEVFAPMLNFSRNGDGTPAHGLATFRASEACLSHEVQGPLRPADDGQHVLGTMSDGRKVHEGAIDRENARYGGEGLLSSPKEFIRDAWQRGSKDAFIGRVEEREDFNDFHVNACGKKAKGRKKWQEWKPKIQPTTQPRYPELPPPRDPTEPPPRQPIDPPGEPGRPVIDPGPIPGRGLPKIALPSVDSTPTNTGPAEEEQPSLRGVIVPDFDAPTGTGIEEARSHGVGTEDEVWQRAYGFTPSEFFSFLRGSHRVSQGTAAQEPAAKLALGKVLLQAVTLSTFAQDSKGQWYGKRGAGANTFDTLMPGGLEGFMAYKARNGTLLAANHTLTDLALNYKQGSYEIKTMRAMGARKTTVGTVVSGLEESLDYTDDVDNPALRLTFRDENGVTTDPPRIIVSTSGTDEEIAYLSDVGAGSGDISSPTNLVTGRVPVATGVKAIDDSDFTMTSDGTNVLGVGSGTAISLGSNNLTGVGTLSRSGNILQKGQVRAFRNTSTQAIGAASWTKVQLNGETFDTDGVFDNATNYRYLPTSAGKYRASARMIFSAPDAEAWVLDPISNAVNVAIYKNGSAVAYGVAGFDHAGLACASVTDDVDLNGSTDYLEIFVYCATAANLTNGTAESYASFERVD